ncbi:galanin receptor type 2-like [Haliotis rufescens]|uniref:galanin receptor type 2-like n=1 Tax=Haliotis rufescens TaxID=6454 RepID=UPI00201F7439|nr:galanin receptor type 2-like [Haliotis rufescens]
MAFYLGIAFLLCIVPVELTDNSSSLMPNGTDNSTHVNRTRICLTGDIIIEITADDNITCDREQLNGTDGHGGDGKKVNESDYIGIITVPLFFILSVFGNSLTIAVMLGKKFRSMTSSLILIVMALSDTCFSCIIPFNRLFFRVWVGYDVRALSSGGCSFFFIMHKTSKMSSSWFIVFVCFERFVAVLYPLRTKLICTKRNALIGIAGVYTGLFLYNGFWTFSVRIVNGVCVPNYATPETAAMARVFLILGTFIYSLVPSAILLVLTPAICFQLARHSKLRRKMSNKQDTQQDETNKTTAMLLGVTLAFFTLVTPISIAHNIAFTLGVNFFESTDFKMVVVRETLQVMEQINYSINFFMYVMCSRAFRRRLGQILGCKFLQDRRSESHASSSVQTAVSTVYKNN